MVSNNKQLQVQTLIDAIEGKKNFALVKFDKTLHTTLENLRKELRDSNAKLKVVKNSLFIKALNKLAAKDKNFKTVREQASGLKDNTAFLMLGEDWSRGLSAFYKFIKGEQSLSFKIGFLDNAVYSTADLTKIAQLPGKDQLIAKIIGGMKTPLSNFNYALKFNMQKFVYILSEKSKQS